MDFSRSHGEDKPTLKRAEARAPERGRPRPQRVRQFDDPGFHLALRMPRFENQGSRQCLAAADENVRAPLAAKKISRPGALSGLQTNS
jgi:hypothetical protein